MFTQEKRKKKKIGRLKIREKIHLSNMIERIKVSGRFFFTICFSNVMSGSSFVDSLNIFLSTNEFIVQ